MDTEKAKSCLKTFLEVSEIQIRIRESAIKRKNSMKRIMDSESKNKVNTKIMELTREKLRIQGQLDCVRLEILDMILDDPSLISKKMLEKKGCSSVTEFVKREKANIELRGLYSEYPFSISKVLEIAMSSSEEYRPKVTPNDVKATVDTKNVKVMTKYL